MSSQHIPTSLVQNRDCRRWRWQLQSHSRWWHHKRRNRFCGGGRGRGLVDPRRGLPDPGKPFLSPRPSSISYAIRCLGEMCTGGGVWALGGLVASGLDGALSCCGPFQFAPCTFESVTRCGSIGQIRAKPYKLLHLAAVQRRSCRNISEHRWHLRANPPSFIGALLKLHFLISTK